ncbi:TPA: hypothetical protein GE516_02190 [Escherichia coli]|nr:hypothetical protein [Escherichia coli]HAJ0669852.1 hypothetical protein [Escherichia coli]
MLRRIAFGKPLLYGIAHDVAELLPRAGRDFQKALILNNPQQGSEILRFKFGNGQMTNRREDMVFHTGENTGGIISRPFFVGFVPGQRHRHRFKALFRGAGGFLCHALLRRVDILRQ